MLNRPKSPKHNRIKPKQTTVTAEQKRFHNFVRNQGCLVCGKRPSIHHVISDGHKRIAKDHDLVTPLCWEHHQGDKGYHGLGSHDAFVKVYGINLYEKAQELRAEYDDILTKFTQVGRIVETANDHES